MPSNACSASSNTTAESPLDMRKKPLITWGCHLPQCFYGYDETSTEPSELRHSQKYRGGFRTQDGVEAFCVIRSYLASLHKQGENPFYALTKTFQGSPHQPRFS